MALYDGYGNNITVSATDSNKFKGKKALWLGDSISETGNPTYPARVCSALGMTLVNKASSGGHSVRMRNILQGIDGYTAPNLSGIDVVFIMIGHNCDSAEEGLVDGVSVVSAISDIPTDDTSYADFPKTFHGNVGSCVEYIWAQNSDIQIYLLTPIQGATIRYLKTTPKARNALIEIGRFYSIPVIDVYSSCGICRKNIGTYTFDDVHPNEAGIVKIVDCVEGFLRNN